MFGVVLVLFNCYYLKCTRGQSSTRWKTDQCTLCRKRPCKVRSAVACNILIIYQLVLVLIELICATLHHPYYSTEYFVTLWTLFLFHYIIISVLCLPVAYIVGACRSYSQIGPIHAGTVFEFFNHVLLYALIIGLSYSKMDYRYSTYFGITGVTVTYVMLIYLAYINYSSFKVFTKIISKEEAVNVINRKVNEVPYIKWQSVGK